MSSIQTPDLRLTARGAIKFRRLIDFLSSIDMRDFHSVIMSGDSWEEILNAADIVEVKEIPGRGFLGGRSGAALICKDGTFYQTRFPYNLYQQLAVDWGDFVNLNPESRSAIIDAVRESSARGPNFVRKSGEHFDAVFADGTLNSSNDVVGSSEFA